MGPFSGPLGEAARNFTIAAFLIAAGNLSYFTYTDWSQNSNELAGTKWWPEYDMKLGEPTSPANTLLPGKRWKYARNFSSGTTVYVDIATREVQIDWAGEVDSQEEDFQGFGPTLDFPATWEAPSVSAVIDRGAAHSKSYSYVASARNLTAYKSPRSVNFPYDLVSRVDTNQTYLVQANGSCTTYFFDGIPYDGSPFDGLLWLLEDPSLFVLKTVDRRAQRLEEVWSLKEPVKPSAISAYWHAELHMAGRGSLRRLTRLVVYGLGVDGKNHTLEEDYEMKPGRAPPSSAFRRPAQCGKCVNCY